MSAWRWISVFLLDPSLDRVYRRRDVLIPGNWYEEKLRWIGPSPYDSSPQVMLNSSTAASLGASSVLCCEETVVSIWTRRQSWQPQTYLDEVGVKTLPAPARIPKRLPRVIIRRRPAVEHHTVLRLLAKHSPCLGQEQQTIVDPPPTQHAANTACLYPSSPVCGTEVMLNCALRW